MNAIDRFNTEIVPEYAAALRQCYATLNTAHRNPVPHQEASDRRMDVQDQMWDVYRQIDTPCYVDPDTFCLVEGTIPHREGFVSCTMDQAPQVSIYLNAEDYDYPVGLESKIIGEECR
jgi:hypothetical protein